MRRLLALAFCAVGACAPKGVGDSSSTPVAAPSSAATAAGSADAARSLLERAFGAGRLAWEDPPFKPGERVVWRVRATGAPDLVIDLGRGQSTVDAPEGAWSLEGNGAKLSIDLFPPRLNEAAFTTEGGTFVGNEVVRVAGGEFRARHGLLVRGASTFHVYIARSVPGGMVKLEEFREGSLDPVFVVELEEFEKPKKSAQ